MIGRHHIWYLKFLASFGSFVVVLAGTPLCEPTFGQSGDIRTKLQSYQLAQQAIPLLQANRDKEAATLLWKASQLNPNDAKIQYNLALAFSRMKQPKDAWKAVSRAVQLDPNDWHGWVMLGDMYGECGDKVRAIKTLQDGRTRFAGDPKARSTFTIQLAQSYTKFNMFREALKEYETASKLEPGNSDLVHNMMYCQTKIGDLDGLQDTRKSFADKFPTHADSKTMQEEIKYYEKDFKATKEREQSQSASAMEAPFDDVPMPLKIYVHDRLSGRTVWSNKPQAGKDKINYSVLVERAFTDWSNASSKKLTFMFIDNPAAANIECEWTEDRAKLHYAFAGGVTSYGTNNIGQPKARIFLLIDYKNPGFNETEFYTTSLHEIGHAIGLSHSSSPKDIMYFSSGVVDTKSPGLSQNDIARIRKLYKIM